MSTRNLAFGGVISALSAVCIVVSSLFHLIFPLVIACVFYYVCSKRAGLKCAAIVVLTSNLIGFALGGIGGGEILFSVLLFSPYALIICLADMLPAKPAFYAVKAVIYAVFSLAVFLLFATVLKDFVGLSERFGEITYVFGAVWTVVMTAFGFALERGCAIFLKRFRKK